MVVVPPRRYRWTGARMEVRRRVEEPESPWRTCPTCWGQRREFCKADDGLYRWRPCARCLGIGEVPSA